MGRLIFYYFLSFLLVLPVSFPASLLFNGGFPMFTFTFFWIVAIQCILYRISLKTINRKKKWHLIGGPFLSLITAVVSFYFYLFLVLLEIRNGLFP
jgi:hypothetical protein